MFSEDQEFEASLGYTEKALKRQQKGAWTVGTHPSVPAAWFTVRSCTRSLVEHRVKQVSFFSLTSWQLRADLRVCMGLEMTRYFSASTMRAPEIKLVPDAKVTSASRLLA